MDKLLCINLNKEDFDFSTIRNRRFMFHPSGWLILGAEDSVSSKKLLKSHAEEHYEASLLYNIPPFDYFLRGWIGIGGAYMDGIIHFAPHIPDGNIELFDKAFTFIEVALDHGFSRKTVLRGFPGDWEQPINKVIPELENSLDSMINNVEAAKSQNKQEIHNNKKSDERQL